MTDLSEVKAGGPAIGTAMPRVEDPRLLQAQAQDGADAVELDIEPLPAVTDAAAGQRAVTVTAVRGDADAAFASAPYTRKEKLCTHRHTAMPIETRGLLAEWDPAGTRLRLSGAAKVPFMNRGILARLFEMSETDVEQIGRASCR